MLDDLTFRKFLISWKILSNNGWYTYQSILICSVRTPNDKRSRYSVHFIFEHGIMW